MSTLKPSVSWYQSRTISHHILLGNSHTRWRPSDQWPTSSNSNTTYKMSSAYCKFEGHVNHQNNFEVKIMVRTRIEVFLASLITNVRSNDNFKEVVPTAGKPMSIHSLHKLQFIRKWVRKPIINNWHGSFLGLLMMFRS